VKQKVLNEKQQRAAALCAEDELTDEEIAASVGISRTTLHRLKYEPLFLDKRVECLDMLHQKSLAVIQARADAMPDDAPGTNTGLMVRQVKQIGTGPNAVTIEEFQIDAALMKEIRAIQEQAAAELGQKVDKVAVTGDVIVRRYVGVQPEDV
jgi:hypothetical protein